MLKTSRSRLPLLVAAATLGFSLAGGSAWAQLDSLTIMAPAAPGGGWDGTARAMQQTIQEEGIVGNVEVTNIPGAGGTIGLAQFSSNAAGQGDQLMVTGLVMVGAVLTNNSPVSLEQTTPIARLTGEYEVIVVPAASEIQTLDDLIEKFKAEPRSVAWAGGSAGGTDHILVGLIAGAVGVEPSGVNYIAFSGGGEALAALLANDVTAGVSGLSEFAGQIEAGELRAIAISSPERLEGSDIPTLIEQGVDVDLVNWRAVVAPPNLEEEDRQQLLTTVESMVQSETWKNTLEQRGWMDSYLAGDEFAAFLEEDRQRIEGVLKDIGLVR
ncbi:MAG TPA: tripartite tricarboxylate transporter substrate binding protein [Alphaproteobacteria bacterium]|nr:tripartite tricarboxylate transporter substrate binding protein [Alphaproteobacteria bacterium]